MVDHIFLVLVELALIVLSLFSALQDHRLKTRKDEAQAGIKRGSKAMAIFYGAFSASTATLIAIPLSVEVAKGFRIPLVLLNTAIPAYLCFFSAWFRNEMVGFSIKVAENVEGGKEQ